MWWIKIFIKTCVQTSSSSYYTASSWSQGEDTRREQRELWEERVRADTRAVGGSQSTLIIKVCVAYLYGTNRYQRRVPVRYQLMTTTTTTVLLLLLLHLSQVRQRALGSHSRNYLRIMTQSPAITMQLPNKKKQ